MCSPIDDAMKRAQHPCFVLFLVTSLLLCFFPSFSAAQDQQPSIRFVRNPDPAPDFRLTGLDGKPVTLADSKGKVILLNFWATWCGPCRAELYALIDLQAKYKDRFQILSLIVDDDDSATIQAVVEKYGINYPVALAPNEIRMQYGGIAALPTSFVLDTEGRIVQKHEGLRDPRASRPAHRQRQSGNFRRHRPDLHQERRPRHRAPRRRSFQTHARAKNRRAPQIQRRRLQLRLPVHPSPVPHLRPQLPNQQNRHRENHRRPRASHARQVRARLSSATACPFGIPSHFGETS